MRNHAPIRPSGLYVVCVDWYLKARGYAPYAGSMQTNGCSQRGGIEPPTPLYLIYIELKNLFVRNIGDDEIAIIQIDICFAADRFVNKYDIFNLFFAQ